MRKKERFMKARKPLTLCLSACLSLCLLLLGVFAKGSQIQATSSDGDEDLELLLTKKVLVDHSKVAEPAVNFMYSIQPAGEENLSPVENVPVEAGSLTLFRMPKGTSHPFEIMFGDESPQTVSDADPFLLPSQVETNSVNDHFEYSRTVKIPLDNDILEKTDPGIYRFVASEHQESSIYSYNNLSGTYVYDGITYDSTEYYIDLYVFGEGQGSPKFVVYEKGATRLPTDKNVKKTLTFTSDYRTNPDDLTKGTHSVKITNTVTGNMSDPSQEFTFNLRIVSMHTSEGVETYYLEVKNDTQKVELPNPMGHQKLTLVEDGTNRLYKCTDLTTVNITLKNDETITIYGLSSMDSVQIAEPSLKNTGTVESPVYSTEEGYTATIDGQQPQYIFVLKGPGKVVGYLNGNESTKLTSDLTVDWLHNKNISGPTGLLIDSAPFLVVTALAGVAIVLICRRRKSTE